ncbi:MAG: PH domain-containing protein [Gammaproteobacteria bacterium]
MQTFESKRDRWLMLILWSSVLIDFLAAVVLLRMDVPLLVRASGVAVMLSTALFIVWILTGTRYTVDQGVLIIRCGPFRQRLRIADIESVEATRSPLSSPALSLDRLRITYGGGKRVLVSPEDKARFQTAIGHARD